MFACLSVCQCLHSILIDCTIFSSLVFFFRALFHSLPTHIDITRTLLDTINCTPHSLCSDCSITRKCFFASLRLIDCLFVSCVFLSVFLFLSIFHFVFVFVFFFFARFLSALSLVALIVCILHRVLENSRAGLGVMSKATDSKIESQPPSSPVCPLCGKPIVVSPYGHAMLPFVCLFIDPLMCRV